MKTISRRRFIKASAAGITAVLPWQRVLGANEDIRVAIVGIRGKGSHHISMFRDIPGVRVTALCDADTEILDREQKKFDERSEKVRSIVDVRKILDDKNIDAIVTATPNHWHALLTIWACQAGKDVYVEKPASHSIWEGRKMVEAVEKYNRIAQVGMHSRSGEAIRQALEYIRQGNLGAIKVVRGFCTKPRRSIGKVCGPQPIPGTVDYDLWSGPAALKPLMRKRLHYDWHWVWDTGNGDIANQGVHEMDLCRWALGQNQLPPRVMSIGGRFGYDDDGETANTQMAVFDYKPAPLIFEVRGLPTARRHRDDPKAWGSNMSHYKGIRIGIAIECENGYYAGGGGGGWVYDNDGKKIRQFTGEGCDRHQANFIAAVRSRKTTDLNAPVIDGHLSAALCHMANISHRLGTSSVPKQIRGAIKDICGAADSYERFQDHIFANEINLEKTPVIAGPWLDFDASSERFTGESFAKWANAMIKDPYREPFVVPEKV